MVQFYPWFKFYFPLFWGMVMYDNEFKTRGNKIFSLRKHPFLLAVRRWDVDDERGETDVFAGCKILNQV